MRVLPLVLGATGVGFLVILFAARRRLSGGAGKLISYETETPRASGYMAPAISIPPQLSLKIINSARKWAQVRGVPMQEILATILVESSGKPHAWANLSTEDSRGLMQVNVNTWGKILPTKYGISVADLWDIDKNIMVGSDIYASYRKKVQDLIAKSGCPQVAPIDVLTRLYYKGPAYVQKKILACQDASSPYKNADKAIANWKLAMSKVSAVV